MVCRLETCRGQPYRDTQRHVDRPAYPTRALTKYLFRRTLGLTMVNRIEKMAASPVRGWPQPFAHHLEQR
jgi:hypothetical protein